MATPEQIMLNLVNSANSTPQERNFARMRLANRSGVAVHTPPVKMTTPSQAPALYRAIRLRDPIHAASYRSFYTVMLYEHAHTPPMRRKYLKECTSDQAKTEMEKRFVESENVASVINSFAKVTLMDETAISIALRRHGPGAVADSYPRLLAALRNAVENRRENPALATDAYIGLSYFALMDPSVGNHINFLDAVLEPRSRATSLRKYLKDEASVVFRRATYKVILQDVDGSIKDLKEAIALANAQESKQRQEEAEGRLKQPANPDHYDFTGLTWSFTGCLGKLLHSAGRNAQALEAFETVVDAMDDAFRDFPDDFAYDPIVRKGPVSPITGGRERDPQKFAKAISLEYGAAELLFSAYQQRKNPQKKHQSRREYLSEMRNRIAGDTKELRRRGLARYKSAVAKEATLPAEALPSMDGNDKMLCQALLANMPTVGRHVSGGVMECHACGSVDHQGLKTCAGCLQAAYCSAKCQKKHWKEHKIECKKIQAERAKKDGK